MKKIALVFGTRPEAIKLAPVYLAAKGKRPEIHPEIWLTGQHQEMLTQVMDIFGLVAERNFSIMTPNQSLNQIAARVLNCFEAAALENRPDIVVVQGDTTTTAAASLAAFYLKIPVAHIEAGLRTNNKFSPYPEEANRRISSVLADFHFAPTEQAKNNLLAEGIAPTQIWVTGNTVIDALDIVVQKVRTSPPVLSADFPLSAFENQKKVVLITGHRRENFGSGFESLCLAIRTLAEDNPDVSFVYPVHLNPQVREPVYRLLAGSANVHLIEPLDYQAFVWAMDRASFVISDSGGIQEEAPHLGKPVLVTRDTTERPEAVAAGTARLVGTEYESIVGQASLLLHNKRAYEKMSKASNPFGDGHASERIIDVLLNTSLNAPLNALGLKDLGLNALDR